MQRDLTPALIAIAIFGLSAEGAGCTTNTPSSAQEDAGTQVSGDDAGTQVVDAGTQIHDASTDADAAPAPAVDAGCTGGHIDFGLTVDSTAPVFFSGGQPGWLDSFGCPLWLAIAPAGQSPLNLAKGACFVSCPASQPELAMAKSYTWDGSYYPPQQSYDASACTSLPANCACQTPVCAAPGDYVATICVGYGGEDGGVRNALPTCKAVPFVWPPTSGSASISETITPTPDGGTEAVTTPDGG